MVDGYLENCRVHNNKKCIFRAPENAFHWLSATSRREREREKPLREALKAENFLETNLGNPSLILLVNDPGAKKVGRRKRIDLVSTKFKTFPGNDFPSLGWWTNWWTDRRMAGRILLNNARARAHLSIFSCHFKSLFLPSFSSVIAGTHFFFKTWNGRH